ncbi:diguanylate cyclase domain-containing protein [Azospira restricta]|uniref:Diguanylate cyclase n=1 Tax=Azospira restricta TaxID=404405 RepID=A0A974PXH3_9RHOO|nr:diguanylate cyclase [Azospira restricta]QRJ62958.1 diguanylate cyclase [Azospira restricta]
MKNIGASPCQPDMTALDQEFHFLAYPDHVLLFMLDGDGRCEFVSPSWSLFTGREAVRELGDGWLEHVHADDRERLARGLDEARRARREVRLLFRSRREDGIYRWFVSQGMPRPDGGYAGLCFDVTAYQEGEAEAERAAQHMISLLRQTRLIGVVLDLRGRVQFSNGGLCRLLQCPGAELMDCHLFERHLSAGDRRLLAELYPGGVQSAQFPAEFESELLARDGEARRISWHAMTLRDFSGRTRNTVLIGDDVTELHRAEEKLSLSARIFDASNHAIVVTGLDGSILAVNDAFTSLTGYTREEAVGRNPRILQSGRHDADFYRQMWTTLLESGHWYGDIWDRRKDGSFYPKYLSISVIRNAAGEPTSYSGIFYDISERKTIEERLDRLAHYDTLTGLPNRCLLLDRLEQATGRALRQGGKVGLLYLDLDHFKQVNDTLGHGAGDELLKAAAVRMRSAVRAADTVARLGGDEFVVLIPDAGSDADLARVAEKIVEALAPPYEIEGTTVSAEASVGVAIFPDDGVDIHELMKHADAAMYQVKQGGRGFFRFYHELAG